MEQGRANPYLPICGILLNAVRNAIACLEAEKPEQALSVLRAARVRVDEMIEN